MLSESDWQKIETLIASASEDAHDMGEMDEEAALDALLGRVAKHRESIASAQTPPDSAFIPSYVGGAHLPHNDAGECRLVTEFNRCCHVHQKHSDPHWKCWE